MSATLEKTASEDVSALCRHLAKNAKGKPVALADLPKSITIDLVAKALIEGFVQIGRRVSTTVITKMEPQKDNKGHLIFDENFRHLVHKEKKLIYENDWSWTDLKGQGYKQLHEVVEDDAKKPDGAKLHLRLTTAGLAAAM